jgi:hypothetical protein
MNRVRIDTNEYGDIGSVWKVVRVEPDQIAAKLKLVLEDSDGLQETRYIYQSALTFME